MNHKNSIFVYNPKSSSRVKVDSNNTIALSLTNDKYPGVRVYANGPINCVDMRAMYDRKIFTFQLLKEADNWSAYSECHLGEIWIESENDHYKIDVVLKCKNDHKTKVITSVNPDCITLRCKPDSILETILYSPDSNEDQCWTWEWSPNHDLGLDLIGDSSLSLNPMIQVNEMTSGDSPSCLYARLPRLYGIGNRSPYGRQFHFWHRFDERMLRFVSGKKNSYAHSVQNGIVHVGDLWFNCNTDNSRIGLTMLASIHLDLNHATLKSVSQTLSMSRRTDSGVPFSRDTFVQAELMRPKPWWHDLQPVKTNRYLPQKPMRSEAILSVLDNKFGDLCVSLSAQPADVSNVVVEPVVCDNTDDCAPYYWHEHETKKSRKFPGDLRFVDE